MRVGDWNLRVALPFDGYEGEVRIAAEGELAMAPDEVTVMPTIEATYVGDHYGRLYSDLAMRIIDAAGEVYENGPPGLGATCIAADHQIARVNLWMVLRGGTVRSVECWAVPADRIGGLVVEVEDLHGDGLGYLAIGDGVDPIPGSTAAGVEPEPIEIDALVGDTVRYLDWEITVTSLAVREWAGAVGEPDESGDVAMSIGVEAAYVGSRSEFLRTMWFGVVGSSRIYHERSCAYAGGNDLMSVNEMFPGSRVSRDRCVLVRADEPHDHVVRIWDDDRGPPLHIAVEAPPGWQARGPVHVTPTAPTTTDGVDLSQPGRSLDNPLPMGSTAEVGDWAITPTSYIRNALPQVREEWPDAIEDPGEEYVAVGLEATHLGSRPPEDRAWQEVWIAVVGGVSRMSYESIMAPGACSISDLYSDWEAEAGLTMEATVCWLVDAAEADQLTLILSRDENRHYISLTSDQP